MSAIENLKNNVNALMADMGWTSNARIIEASDSRLTNGTLGRIRGKGENVKLSQVEELARVFGVQPHELLAPDAAAHLTSPPIHAAVKVVLDALAASPHRAELKQLLPMLIDTDAPAYRLRLAELLAGELGQDMALSKDLVASPIDLPSLTKRRAAERDHDADIASSNVAWRMQAIRLAEVNENEWERALLVRFIGMLDGVMRQLEPKSKTAHGKAVKG